MYLDSNTLPVIINTTISGNSSEKGGGIYCESDTVTIKNSIIWENTPSELFIHTDCEQSVTYCAIKGGYPGETNFHADPLFIDPDNGDYQLDPTSPCLYAGTSEDSPDTDIEGTARPQGYGYDLGAYESVFSGQRPVIDSFSADMETGMVPLEVTFTCIAHAVESDAVIQQYTIDFGDGSDTETNTSGIFSHLYQNVGVYHATCTVQDDQGNIVVSRSVSVHAAGSILVPSEYSTIQDAIDVAFEGCTILIADGAYSGAGNIDLMLSGKSVTIISENGPGSCIIDCQDNGRGFYIENGDQSIISGITVLNGNEYYGGGMEVRDASPTVIDCVFEDNTASAGGGIYCYNSSPVIDDCVFANNETVEVGSTPYSRIGGGGIAFWGGGPATVENSVFRGNSSFYSGGGIYSTAEIQIFNCIFDQNEAEGGGGIYFFGTAPADVTNCTFSGNSSTGSYDGGAIHTYYSSKTIKNCILWENTPDEISMDGLSSVVTYCDVYGDYEGEGNFHAEPLFADTENGDFRLLTNSPCIDAGTSDGAPDADIEGTERPQKDGYDMGAYEIAYDGQRPIVDSFSADTVREQIPFVTIFTCIAHDPDGVVATYTIDYGDGSTLERNSTGVFTHTYNSVGPCWAVCTTTDDDGTSVNSLPIYILRQGAIYVPSDYSTVQEAIDAAYDGDAIVLADGIYTGDGNTSLNFEGKAITVRSENGPENCIIDLENNGRAFIMTSEGPDTIISGLTVRNGYMRGYGGAVFLRNASPTIQSCIFTQNTVYADTHFPACGGAISMRGTSSPNIINCLFSRNQAIGYYEDEDDPEYSYGSAIFCEDESNPSIVNCTIVFNTGDYEAAVYSEETLPFIGNSIVWGNTPANISTGNGDFWDAEYNDVEGDYPGIGNFHGDPLFMDADNDNYRLSISSPCIYAASGDEAPAEDILGVERPAGVAPDMGVYEATGYSTTRPVVDSFTADQVEGETPFPVNFTCQASDADGLITAYTMDFGDGSDSETNTTGFFSHIYSSGGTFFAYCTVADDAGIEVRTKSITLKVHEIRKVPSQYATIQAAIDAALDEDIVQLADGIYTGEGNKNLNFNGKPLTLRSENGPENSIIDCEGDGRGFIFDSNEDNSSVVSGISIINGNEDYGGAIYSYRSMPLIRNCILSNNTATYGGAIHFRAATIDNCGMFNNSARYGGAISFSADENVSAVTDCEFESNIAEEYGGAIYIFSDGNCSFSGCTFYRNSAESSGGGIYTYNGSVDVSQSIFIENSAGRAGAIALGRYGSSVVNCIFTKNTADSVGGAITGSDTEDLIANCTFYKNTATQYGGAIRTYIDYSNIPTLINNIFWENSPDQIRADSDYEPDVTYSCIQGGYTGEGNFHGDPLFVDPENLDFHLQTNSPCMYAGTEEGAPDIDFEGNPRPQGYGYDLGAYETNGYELNRPIIDSFTSDSVEGELPFDVGFSGSAHDTDGTIVSYTIDYGDGTPPETNETGNFVHTYTSIGYGDAFITVTDDSGAAANSHSILIKRYGSVYVPSEYPTIQNAVDVLLDGNTIVVADGVYTGEGNTNINVYGKALTIKSLNGPENCIIDCQGTGRGFIFENGETKETVISGFTIINGNGDAETTNTFGQYRGGGIYCYGASPTIDNCIVKGNTASYGGGFYCDDSSPIITNCFFLENTSSSEGGGLCFRDSTVSMANCIVRENTSDGYGGGIASFYTDTPTSVTNCIIADNSAANAGGIYASGSSELFTMINCTITANTADNSGGGILCEGWLSLDVSNSILWNNTPDEIQSSTYNTITVQYSDVQGGYEGEGNFHGDPLFADPESSDFRLTISSPCIDAGTSTEVPDSDIEGTVRPQGLAHDMGAYEAPDYGGTRPVIASFSSDITEGNIPLTVVFTCSASDPDGQIVSYTMDYGDGSLSETNTSGVFPYTYTTAGFGDATCSVLDNDGISVNSESIIIKRYGVMHVPSEYETIQAAVDAQFENGIIHVADGIYTGEGNKNIDFKGKTLTLLSENGPLYTVIACDGKGAGFIFQNGEGEETVVSGFGITGGSGYEYGNNPSSGGGIYCRDASPTIDNCLIFGNTATYGGGIYCDYYATPKITKCVLVSNVADNGGGVYCDNSSGPAITGCHIWGNYAQRGGGVYSSESDPIIVNSIVERNSSRYGGGGIYCTSYSSVNITNTTFSENVSLRSTGGGIYCYYYSSLTISNSILWGDYPDEIFLGYNSDAVLEYCLVQGGWAGGTGIIDADPLFGSGLHLQAGSPCRDAGDPTSMSPQFPEDDMDGEARPQGSAYDIGADEFCDSDGDDIPDDWEYEWFGDLSHDEDTNSDTDTLTDLEEFQNATDPFDPDSDDDGLYDGDEVNIYGTNPLVFDNGAPTAPSLNQPSEGAEVPTLTPTLSVNNSSDPEDQTVDYSFELYADASLSELIASAEKVEAGDGTTAWPLDFNLEDHTACYWRSRAFDGHNPSDWMEMAQFFINTANEEPGAPIASTPVDGSSVPVLQPTLTVCNADNADQDALTYEYEVYSDDAMLELAVSIDGVLEGNIETSWQVNTELDDNSWYWWRARARDDEDVAGEWSELQSVFINTGNEAPAGLTISSPEDGEEMTGLDVTLAVTNAVDPESEMVTYDFQIDTGSTFNSADLQEGTDLEEGAGGVTSWSLFGLSDNTLYRWRARAYDGEVYGEWMTGSFFVNLSNDVPTAPVVAGPGDGSQVVSTAPTLSVIPALDPDMDLLTYTFEVYNDEFLTSLVVSESGVETSTWKTLGYLDNYSTYYWRACANDEHGTQGPWSETAMFTVFAAPEAPMINSPSNGGVVEEDMPTLSVINGQAAGDEPLAYSFEIYADKYLTGLVDAQDGVPEGDTLTSYTVAPTLENEATYYWRVKACDGVLESSWTPTAVVLVALDVYEVEKDIVAYRDVSASSTEIQVVTVSNTASDLAGTTVEIPAGALGEDITIIISEVTNPPALPDGVVSLGGGVDFGPDGLQFDQAVTIRIPYSQDLMDAAGYADPGEISVWTYNTTAGEWEEIEVDGVDTVNMVLVCSTTHFSIYRAAALVISDAPVDTGGDDSSNNDDGGGGGCFICNAICGMPSGSGCWIGLGAIFSMILVPGVYRRRRD